MHAHDSTVTPSRQFTGRPELVTFAQDGPQMSASPQFGEDTDAVLVDLGYNADEIADLRKAGQFESYCRSIPAARMAAANFLVSRSITSANSAGVLPTDVVPCSRSRALNAGDCTIATMVFCSL